MSIFLNFAILYIHTKGVYFNIVHQGLTGHENLKMTQTYQNFYTYYAVRTVCSENVFERMRTA